MRLVCPNCGAQYEVDDRVMPENGRDVQCSNCGHAWFQLPPSAEPADEAAETPSPFDDIDTPDDEHDDVAEDAGEEEASVDDVDSDDGDADAPSSTTPTRQLDDSVRSILQEEAELELKARDAEREGLETQPDLGLDEAPGVVTDDNVSRLADLGGEKSEDQVTLAADDLKGRDVLPDIEEINSTLDAPENDQDVALADDPIVSETGSGGFRRGFILVVVLACLLATLYIFAPAIGERIPALQPVLELYIEIADRVRVALEDTMRNAIGKMQGLIDKPENG